jgi:hypothetical protein
MEVLWETSKSFRVRLNMYMVLRLFLLNAGYNIDVMACWMARKLNKATKNKIRVTWVLDERVLDIDTLLWTPLYEKKIKLLLSLNLCYLGILIFFYI